MKIQAAKIDGFIKDLSHNLLGCLLYGPDSGLASMRADIIAKQIVPDLNDPFSVVDISPDKLKDGPAILSDEINAISFGGGRRLIRIKDIGSGVSGAIKSAFDSASDDTIKGAFVLITAGELPPSSALRKFFESSQIGAALPCYQDDVRSLMPIISSALSSHGYSFDRDIVPFLAENCLGDRLVVLKEIEKLMLFKGEDKHITLEDAKISVGETTQSSFDDICEAIADGNQIDVERHLRKALLQGAMPVAVLRSVQRYFYRLCSVSGIIQEGESQEAAISSLKPPVFFKQMPIFRRHVSKWSRKDGRALWKAMSFLYEAEKECKKTGANPELMCSRFLMKITAISSNIR